VGTGLPLVPRKLQWHLQREACDAGMNCVAAIAAIRTAQCVRASGRQPGDWSARALLRGNESNNATIAVRNSDSLISRMGYAAETPRPDLPFCSESMAALSTGM